MSDKNTVHDDNNVADDPKLLEKLDKITSLMEVMKGDVARYTDAVSKQSIILEEMKIGADFRRRESENSVREIKTQMTSMDVDIERRNNQILDKILIRMEQTDEKQEREFERIFKMFDARFTKLEGRVGSIEIREKISIVAAVVLTVLFLLI